MNERNTIELEGTIYFDPDDKTKKHQSQASWKRMALIMFNGDVANYYAWFLKKRYNLELNKPLRGAHISFINDAERDTNGKWKEVKKKWHKKKIKVVLDLRPHFSTKSHWWLIIPQDERGDIHSIRAELGLGRPYYGLHMTIGHANEKNLDHSNYIINLINNGLANI